MFYKHTAPVPVLVCGQSCGGLARGDGKRRRVSPTPDWPCARQRELDCWRERPHRRCRGGDWRARDGEREAERQRGGVEGGREAVCREAAVLRRRC
ncbi:hypothetical protein Scep_009637 [Stephania cephalantha]|uniref:Uncharacterized protein n=1 Tax=Stephania cephalantha TaxID=152367 RepID=A0AAP0JTI7_9MAGN